MNKKYVEMVGMVLVIVGALNWGLVGLGGFIGTDLNLVHMLLGSLPQLEWLVYIVVGLAGIWLLWDWYTKMSKSK